MAIAAYSVRGVLALCALLGMAVGVSAVDLTPIPSTYELEGVKFANISFKDGAQTIQYTPPEGWRATGAASKCSLVAPNAQSADATIEVESRPPVPNFTAENQRKLIEYAQKSTSPQATKVGVVGSIHNPLQIGGKETFAVELTYELFDSTFRSYVLFLNRGTEFWVFRCTARITDFEMTFEPFRQSLYSITGL